MVGFQRFQEKATKARDASLKEVTAADEQQKQLSEEAALE